MREWRIPVREARVRHSRIVRASRPPKGEQGRRARMEAPRRLRRRRVIAQPSGVGA